MSKYLKWYDSYLDHTPTEDLAKNELESAHRKIKHLTESLAKANERVKELEVLAEERAEFIINASNMASANEVYKRCKFPLKVAINKFATEKKCEGINDFMYHFRYEYEGARDTDSIESFADDFVEQLRKEQE